MFATHAPRYFQGIRGVTTVLFGVLVPLVAGGTAGAVENLLLALGAGIMLGYMLPSQYLTMATRRRQHAIARGLPNALDLMVVCVESGLGIDQTTLQVAKELQSAHPEIADEFTVMNLELRAGKKRADALHNLADRCGVVVALSFLVLQPIGLFVIATRVRRARSPTNVETTGPLV